MTLRKKIFGSIFIIAVLAVAGGAVWYFYFNEADVYAPEFSNFDKIDISVSSLESVQLPEINLEAIEFPEIDFDLK